MESLAVFALQDVQSTHPQQTLTLPGTARKEIALRSIHPPFRMPLMIVTKLAAAR
jgi:hypothetical protein